MDRKRDCDQNSGLAISVWQIRKMRLKEVEHFTPNLMASKCWSWARKLHLAYRSNFNTLITANISLGPVGLTSHRAFGVGRHGFHFNLYGRVQNWTGGQLAQYMAHSSPQISPSHTLSLHWIGNPDWREGVILTSMAPPDSSYIQAGELQSLSLQHD